MFKRAFYSTAATGLFALGMAWLGMRKEVAPAPATRAEIRAPGIARRLPIEGRHAGSTVAGASGLQRENNPEAQMTLASESAAIVAEQTALQLLAKDTGLELSTEQWTTLATMTVDFQAVRHAYEATIAQASVVRPGFCRLEVPAYPVEGELLRRQLYSEVRERLGPGVGSEVAARLGPALEGYFGGFGAGAQTLEFTADASGADSDYQVTRTIQLWSGSAASGRLATRRETFFPGLEDPQGFTWGPFLSVLASQVAAKTGT